MRKQLGITLIELLIAQLLGIFLVCVAITGFIRIQWHAQHLHIILIQRFHAIRAYQLFNDAIIQAGFMGCRSLQERDLTQTGFALSSTSAITVIPGSQAETLIPNQCEPIRSHSDILMIQYAKPFAYLWDDITQGSLFFPLNKSRHAYTQQQDIMIADCEHAQWLSGARIGGNTVYLQQPLSYDYSAQSILANWVTIFYFVANANKNDRDEEGEMALYQRECHGRSEAIITGVEKMDMMLESNGLRMNLLLRNHIGAKTIRNPFQYQFRFLFENSRGI